MKSQNKISLLIIVFTSIIIIIPSFAQLPKGVKVPVLPEFQSIHFAPDEPWPDTITNTEEYYNKILAWRDFFGPSIPKIVVFESIPDTLNYNWFKPRPYVDEEGGGEPFEEIPEKYMIIQYNHYSKTKTKWKNFINETHLYWKNYYKSFLIQNYAGLSSDEIVTICDSIKYYYYEISASDYKKNRIKDNYDQLKFWLFNNQNYRANTIENSLDSILFSNKYGQVANKEPPSSLQIYLNELFEIEKRRLIINGDSTYYKKVKQLSISLKQKPNITYPLWFGTDNDTVYISPNIIRSIITISLNSKTISQEFDINKDVMHEDYFSYEERFLFYDFCYKKEIRNTGQFNYVNRKINTLSNIDLFNASFFQKFSETLSFILQHEMAHVYLARNGITEQKEIKCDCYGLVALEEESEELPGGYSSQGMTAGAINFKYGIVNTLLKACVDADKPKLWNMDDVKELKYRLDFLKNSDFDTPTKNICDSLK